MTAHFLILGLLSRIWDSYPMQGCRSEAARPIGAKYFPPQLIPSGRTPLCVAWHRPADAVPTRTAQHQCERLRHARGHQSRTSGRRPRMRLNARRPSGAVNGHRVLRRTSRRGPGIANVLPGRQFCTGKASPDRTLQSCLEWTPDRPLVASGPGSIGSPEHSLATT